MQNHSFVHIFSPCFLLPFPSWSSRRRQNRFTLNPFALSELIRHLLQLPYISQVKTVCDVFGFINTLIHQRDMAMGYRPHDSEQQSNGADDSCSGIFHMAVLRNQDEAAVA
ncbi:hypothetical protein TNCV_4428561 [Trichonephila clavipes]|nr:hypothetical protein TNCV_4428561 [Trichonephila clavipes]